MQFLCTSQLYLNYLGNNSWIFPLRWTRRGGDPFCIMCGFRKNHLTQYTHSSCQWSSQKLMWRKILLKIMGAASPASQRGEVGMQIEWSTTTYIHTSTSFLLFQNGSFRTFELGKNTRTKTSFLFIPTIYNYYIVMRKKVILLHCSSE